MKVWQQWHLLSFQGNLDSERISDQDLQTVNECGQGKNCRDQSAALDKMGTLAKQPLKSSPFVTEFDCGTNAEGCWTCDHTVLQFED
jgi:hypothetical protein